MRFHARAAAMAATARLAPRRRKSTGGAGLAVRIAIVALAAARSSTSAPPVPFGVAQEGQAIRRGETSPADEPELFDTREDVARLKDLARRLAAGLDYSGAASALERVVALAPADGEAWRELVVVYPLLGRKHDAPRAFERALALGALDAGNRLEVARALRKAGLGDLALRALAADPAPLSGAESGEAGLAALAGDDEDAALTALRRAAEQPAAAEVEYALGDVLESRGELDAAAAHYERALAADPGSRSARFRLGNVRLRQGRRSEAERWLRGYEEYRQWDRRVKLLLFMVSSGKLPEDEERDKTRQLVSLLLQAGELDQAEPVIASALARRPDDPDLRVARARLLLARGERDGAARALAPLLDSDDPPADALWLSARLELLAGRAAPALARFERLVGRDPQPPALLLKEMATAQALLGRMADAEASFRRALAAEPERVDVRVDLGQILEATGRETEAESLYREALDRDPGSTAALVALAGRLTRSRRAGQALGLLDAELAARPSDAALHEVRARVLAALGRANEAAAERTQASSLRRAPGADRP